ncbi:MAG TPA: cytochrome c peroxidase [Bryobacteraceae bacterium]|nr:cytochrome c peroxidase [Bryobacteraceae bacterium]
MWICVLLLAQIVPIPAGLDIFLPAPDANPLTIEKIKLGRQLFFDKRLSRDRSMSCASCHDPKFGFGDSRKLAVGVGGKLGSRRAPRIVNRVYGSSFFWDGRASTLEDQVLKPISDPNEMDLGLAEAVSRVGLEESTLRNALASYVRTILSGDAPYDRYLQGDRTALTEQQRFGLKLFSGKAGCASCHVGPNLTDERFHNTGIGGPADDGRFSVTRKPEDQSAFKTPSLREVALTPPFMHDGSLATLEDVIEFYDKGGKPNPNLDSDIRQLHLSAGEKQALVALLKALSGKIREGP